MHEGGDYYHAKAQLFVVSTSTKSLMKTLILFTAPVLVGISQVRSDRYLGRMMIMLYCNEDALTQKSHPKRKTREVQPPPPTTLQGVYHANQ
jgi:hypothetical protein